ncbi:MAG: Stk1 family PASTA domain-containing Ser/Thr kinase, partial [Bryobacteraceae bacterium]
MKCTVECYEVVEWLGTGGIGSLFKARDTWLNRFVVLRLLLPEFAEEASLAAKLHEETYRTASINHPHVVEMY